MSWKILVIKDGQKASLFLNNIVVSTIEQNYKIPIEDLNVVLFENLKSVVTARLLVKLAEYKVLTIFCDENFNPSCFLQPYKGNFQQLEILNNQLQWTKTQKLLVWTKIVVRKIEAQIDVLKINLKNLEKTQLLYKYIDEIKLGDPSNREGHAAKVYFKELFGNKFTRELDNHVNAALDYGYTIIRNYFSRVIVSKGLHPTIALFHSNKYNAFALSDDLMEPFRPIIDNFVYNEILNKDYFSRNDKINIINILNSKIIFNNKKIYLSNAIEIYVEEILKNLKDEIKEYNLISPIISSIEYYEL